jgi:hypothetical protein
MAGVGPVQDRLGSPNRKATVKVSREANRPKRDNLVDIAGYARCAERLWE